MFEKTPEKRPPRYKKLAGVPTLRTYPIEGMEKGIKIGGAVGGIIGLGLWAYWRHYLGEAGLLVMGGCSVIGSFIGFLLGALTDKLRGKWDS